MTPRIRPRVRPWPGASTGVKAVRLVLRCRGPPRRVDLGNEKDRVAARSSKDIGTLERRTKDLGSECSRVADENHDRHVAMRSFVLAECHRELRLMAVLAMAFSHINLDAPGTAPGRNDPCPCGSGQKARRCCGVDRWRFVPLRGRRRGVSPVDLAERVDQLTRDFSVRFLARTFLPARLAGLAPAVLTDAERGELGDLFDGQREQVDQALEILERVGYGRPRGRRPRSERGCGQRRGERLDGLVGKLPRALAKRLPTSADTHRHGPNDGEDIYGRVLCSQTLRAGHLGSLRRRAGCGIRATRPVTRMRRRPPVSLRS
jgi:hypothetical protein